MIRLGFFDGLRLLQQGLAGLVDIAGAHGEDQIPGPGQLLELGGHIGQSGAVDGTGDAVGNVLGGDTDGCLLYTSRCV